MSILLPKAVADRIAAEERHKSEMKQAERRQETIDQLRAALSDCVTPIVDDEKRQKIRQACGPLLNMRSGILIQEERLTWSELGQLLSDVLLGPGQEFEIKTGGSGVKCPDCGKIMMWVLADPGPNFHACMNPECNRRKAQ